MDKYDVNDVVPMRFHKFLVYFLIPVSLLFSVITFITLIGLFLFAPISVILNLIALGFSFAILLTAEIYLLQMRRLGVILLYVGYLLSAVSSLLALLRDFSGSNFFSLVFMVGIGVAGYIYYEKRAAFFK